MTAARRGRGAALVRAAAPALATAMLPALASWALSRVGGRSVRGRVALVTGGSRGLGLQLARELLGRGAHVAICGRDPVSLDQARHALRGDGRLLALPCDVGDGAHVEALVAEVDRRLGPVDVLVNNAGIIEVGPLETMTLADFAHALDVMFWGPLRATLAVLPAMRARRRGTIVNVTSIGGKVSVPHLLPYCCAKFAAVALSEGLRAEVARDGVHVVTVVPGLMRTGSFLHAVFRGRPEAEFAWFAPSASLPFLTIGAEKAARQIVDAAEQGTSELTLTLPARLLGRLHGNAPGLVTDLLAVANALLPAGGGHGPVRGATLESRLPRAVAALTGLGLAAARRLNQRPSLATGRGQLGPA
jgi:NAD(P)-dependent dehydrogenase (short-subunit alcohol dehydrogenase family)